MNEKIREYALEVIKGIEKYFDNEELMEEQFSSGFRYLKEELQNLKLLVQDELPGAKFEVGEFVYDCKFTKGEKRKNEIVEINNRSYTENRGWVYGITYRKVDTDNCEVTGGGGSAWWDEKSFKKLDDPLLQLIVQKHKLKQEKSNNQYKVKKLESEIEKINYSLRIIRGSLND